MFVKAKAVITQRPDGRFTLRVTRDGKFVGATVHGSRAEAEAVAAKKRLTVEVTA